MQVKTFSTKSAAFMAASPILLKTENHQKISISRRDLIGFFHRDHVRINPFLVFTITFYPEITVSRNFYFNFEIYISFTIYIHHISYLYAIIRIIRSAINPGRS